ncbi:hypothetical protein SLS56_007673 [Neofusicoccum ribis]|uniref:Uncharacterized protein n=1 Tax=Neofusicoccum ribis TaxID=45134 RepID=A0ABR3SM61_9PEZI
MSTSNPKDPRPANTAHAADIRAKRRRERALPQTDWVLSDYEMLLFQENLPRQTMKFMELPLELRNMIYKEFLGQDFSIWNNTLTDDQAKLRIGGMTLLLLSKAINEEARRVLFRQNFSLMGQYAFFVMDSFLHTIGTDSIQHLRHITTTVPFVIYGTDFYRARSDRCGNELRRVYESIRNTCGFRIPRSSRGKSNENGYDVMVKSVRATCRRIAKSNVKKLDLLLPLDGFYITHTPAGYRYRWGKTTLISLIVHNLRETDQPRASACFWTELEELGKTKPELTISLILVHSSGQSWSQLRPHEVQYWRGQAEEATQSQQSSEHWDNR